jgi:DNA-binding transcriptional regulator YdaS (Cro superfamily)
MTPLQLSKLGEQLGAGWQSQLSRLLPCNVRTVQYWLTGEREIRPMVAARIKQAVQDELRRRIEKPL